MEERGVIEEAKQELGMIVGLAVTLSANRTKLAEVQYLGDSHLAVVMYRSASNEKLQYHEMVWLDNGEAWPKLRKIRHDLEQLLPQPKGEVQDLQAQVPALYVNDRFMGYATDSLHLCNSSRDRKIWFRVQPASTTPEDSVTEDLGLWFRLHGQGASLQDIQAAGLEAIHELRAAYVELFASAQGYGDAMARAKDLENRIRGGISNPEGPSQ